MEDGAVDRLAADDLTGKHLDVGFGKQRPVGKANGESLSVHVYASCMCVYARVSL